MSDPRCLEAIEFDGAMLLARHPPVLRHPHKRMVFEECCAAGYRSRGMLKSPDGRPTP